MMGIVFLVSVHKPTGNEVTDDRDSTSSSGAESSWTSRETNMGDTRLFVSKCGPIMRMVFCSVTNPVT